MANGIVKYKKLEGADIQGICVKCNEEKQSHKGSGKFRALCLSCHKERFPAMNKYVNEYMKERRKHEGFVLDEYNKRQRVGYKAFKKDHCEKCGFQSLHSCQLDVDHIDGDKSNNEPSNYQTLCANCHRLKTYVQRNWRKRTTNNKQAAIPIAPELLAIFSKE